MSAVLDTTDGQNESGHIAGIYTVGGPCTARPALTNKLDANGCFGGVRIYTRATSLKSITTVDMVPMILRVGRFEHAMYPVLPLQPKAQRMGTLSEATMPCSKKNARKPRARLKLGSMAMHGSARYVDDLNSQSELSDGSYDELTRLVKIMQLPWYNTTYFVGTAQKLQARLIARVMLKDDKSTLSKPVFDQLQGWNSVSLVQEPDSLKCHIVFLGVDTWNDYKIVLVPKSLRGGRKFCGFSGVHAGVSRELEKLTSSEEFQSLIATKLPYCSEVSALGHSLGAALAEIYAACVNHLASGYDDKAMEHLKFDKRMPKLMDEVDPQDVPDITGF